MKSTLEEKHGQVWNAAQLRKDFILRWLAFPIATVIRRIDNAEGTMEYQNIPRQYYNFKKTK